MDVSRAHLPGQLMQFQLISPNNVCLSDFDGGQDGTTSETPASYAK